MKPTELDSRSAVPAVVTTTVLVFYSFMAIESLEIHWSVWPLIGREDHWQ